MRSLAPSALCNALPAAPRLIVTGGCHAQNFYEFIYARDLQVLVVGLCFAGCEPACGYFGAKQRSKSLVGLFTCCNGFAMCCFATSIVLVFILVGVLNAQFTIGTEHESLMDVINHALPEMKACCKEMVAADFDVEFQGCRVAALDAEAYPVGSAFCPTPSDGSAGGDGSAATDVFCIDSNTCRAIAQISDDVKVSNTMFYVLIALYILACIPATIGCCSGHQLMNSRIMNAGPALVVQGSVGAYTSSSAPYGGRTSATGYGK